MYLTVFETQANLLQALAHPKRLEILNLLAQKNLTVTEIYSMLDLPQANISQHLTKLRQSDVVATKRIGKEILYRLKNRKIGHFLPKSNLIKLGPLVHDPVCHMQLSPKTAVFKHQHQNKTYYFCASGCHQQFMKHPAKYL
ncbi:MAG TPA: metalloregulator ArsR/SmtB family transcription factor [Patescibacteria group bacterium]|nr:metalloregulator ArsR/SmtB family transcription factor [Patescibacteria group bacterium]